MWITNGDDYHFQRNIRENFNSVRIKVKIESFDKLHYIFKRQIYSHSQKFRNYSFAIINKSNRETTIEWHRGCCARYKTVNWCEKRREAASRHVEHKSLDRRDGLVLLHRSNVRWIFPWNFWESLAIHRWSPSNRRFNSRLPVRGEQSTFVRSFVLSTLTNRVKDWTTKYCSLVADLWLTCSWRDLLFYHDWREYLRIFFFRKNMYKWNVQYKNRCHCILCIG